MKKSLLFASIAAFLVLTAIPVFSEEISVGLRLVPPYVMQDAAGKISGLEYDIIAAALAVKGHTVKTSIFPLARVIESVKDGSVQAGAPVLPSHNTGRFLSDVYIVYNNVALGLKASNLKVAAISDLKGLRIVAFQRATIVLGPDFAAAADDKSKYTEEVNQALQIKMLFGNRVDIAIGESRILNYFIKAPETGVDKTVPVVEYKVFPPTEYRVAFVSEKHMTDFNEGLAKIKANKTYDAIIAKYSGK